jgi:MoaA/NifB/PqqE/SkfB family radical SAM enzyme
MSNDIHEDKVIQFEVWNECNNGCKFCSNKFVYNLSDEQKLKTLDIVLQKVKSKDIYENYQRIGFIGGEFFQGQLRNPEVKSKFMELIDVVNGYAVDGYFNQIWICCTLIAKNQDDLWEMIDHITQKDKLWICTSYDTVGRFHTPAMFDQWAFNMKEIKRRYPEVKINTTTILTGDFIRKYMSGEFDLKKMKDEFNTTYFFKPPMIPSECRMTEKEFNDQVLKDFFPERKEFLKFLRMFRSNESQDDYDRLFDTHLRADSLIKTNYMDESERMVINRNKATDEEVTNAIKNDNFVQGVDKIEETHNDTNRHCRHNKAYSPYVDSDRCFYCDKEMMEQTL